MRKKAAFARAREVLDDVGLAERADDPVNTWSHGMQQRLSVARALLTEPPVLLVDEATHDLDPAAAATVRELIAGCAERGAAVLWATQRLDELRGFAERGHADVRRSRRIRWHGRGARLPRAARGSLAATRPSSSRAISPSSRGRRERSRPGRRGGEAPGVRPPRLEDRALLPRGLRRRGARASRCRSSSSSSSRSWSIPASSRSTAGPCRRISRSSSIGLVVNLTAGALLHKVATSLRQEQMTGTFETLLATPTTAATLQLGSVSYTLLMVPVRAAILLIAIAIGFGLDLSRAASARRCCF